MTHVYDLWDKAFASYADQVLPFDVTLAGANEYGAMCVAKVLGVEILNEGTGISVDDAVSEASVTFVARTVEPMQAVPSKFSGSIGGRSMPKVEAIPGGNKGQGKPSSRPRMLAGAQGIAPHGTIDRSMER